MMTFPPCLSPLTSTLFNLNALFLPDYQTAIRKYRHSMTLSDSKCCIPVVNFSSWRRVSVNTEESSGRSSFCRNHFIEVWLTCKKLCIFNVYDLIHWGFHCGSAGKESACNVGDLGLIPGLGRSPEEGKGYPLQYSGPANSVDYIVHGVAKSHTWLSDFDFGFWCTPKNITTTKTLDISITPQRYLLSLMIMISVLRTLKIYLLNQF